MALFRWLVLGVTTLSVLAQDASLDLLQQSALDDVLSSLSNRRLQLDVDFVCSEFMNNAGRNVTCECIRWDRFGVRLTCDFPDELCTTDNSTCLTQAVDIILDGEGRSLRVESCTKFTTGDEPLDTCVQVTPDTPGGYNETVTCEVTLNDKKCKFCEQCMDDTGNTTISFNCCNVEEKKQQTCGYVGPQGASLVLFDPVVDGQCIQKSSGALGPPPSTLLLSGMMLLCTVVTWML